MFLLQIPESETDNMFQLETKVNLRFTSSRPPDEAFSVPFSGVCPGIFWNCALQAEIQVSNVSRLGFLESCQSPQFSIAKLTSTLL